MSEENPDLQELRRRLEEEEAAYAAALHAIDALATFALPAETRPEMQALRARLNELCRDTAAKAESAGGARTWLPVTAERMQQELGRMAAREQEFNSVLVQLLNAHVEERDRLEAHLRAVVSALVRYLQRVLPLVDARDRVAGGLAMTRAELILEAFDRRLESLSRRLQGLLALRDRVETMGEEIGALRAPGAAAPSPASDLDRAVQDAEPEQAVRRPASSRAADELALDDAVYVAFENRFRGSRDEVRERLASYVALFKDLGPVADLGCGRGEFLELLREAGVPSMGVEGNAQAARQCRQLGLDVTHADLLDFLAARPAGSLGGVFAAQVAEHLPPRVLLAMLREAHRVLRPGGLLLLETVNPRSVVGLLEVYNRDLTHERPLHPETLSFLAAAAGFADVSIELRSPVEPAARLQPVPAEGLSPRVVDVLNENVARLNAIIYGPQEYALMARR